MVVETPTKEADMDYRIMRVEHQDCTKCVEQAENAVMLMRAKRATISATGDGEGHRATVVRELN